MGLAAAGGAGRLLAVSDLHLNYPANREALLAYEPDPADWILLVGDIGDTEAQLEVAFGHLAPRAARVIWVPGNHELWTTPRSRSPARGVARYERLVALARGYGVGTPEDEYPLFEGAGGPCYVAPLFLLYDYSFGPTPDDPAANIAWALEAGVRATDERFLWPDPFPDRAAWCRDRVAKTAARLDALDPAYPTVLVNHWQLRAGRVRLPARIQRFEVWCGTAATADWHTRYRAKAVVEGHLHVRTEEWIDGVRFVEVGVGYPRHWEVSRGLAAYVREVLPGPAAPPAGDPGRRRFA